MRLSKRARLISPSVTLEITAKAKKMKQEGINVIGFGAGEPDFDTPDYIKKIAKDAIDAGVTKYTPASGTPELKESICKKLKRDNNLAYSPKEIVVSCGAKHSLYNIFEVLCEQGDEVVLPIPYWVSYPEQIKLAGAKPVFIETSQDDGFKVTPMKLHRAISPKTKIFVLNSPSNPTGKMYSKKELAKLAEILVKENIYCISDEIYEKIIYDGQEHCSIASVSPEMKKMTILINGLSKAYSMTGWRIGYAAATENIISAVSNLQSHSTSNPTSFCQKASIAALNEEEGIKEILEQWVSEFKNRRNYIVEKLNAVEGISCLKPDGAFYVFPNVSTILEKKFKGKVIKKSVYLAQILLEKAKIAVVPGSAFGKEGYLRLSYATSMENIVEGIERLERFVKGIDMG